MSNLKYLRDVATLRLHEDACTGCGMCRIVCPHGVVDVTRGKAVIKDRDLCMECGACARNCPASAIDVEGGVGCAAAVIIGALRGSKPTCDCCADRRASPKTPCC